MNIKWTATLLMLLSVAVVGCSDEGDNSQNELPHSATWILNANTTDTTQVQTSGTWDQMNWDESNWN